MSRQKSKLWTTLVRPDFLQRQEGIGGIGRLALAARPFRACSATGSISGFSSENIRRWTRAGCVLRRASALAAVIAA